MLPTRDCVRQTPAYTPGEQPQTAGFTKLNTNENPYPPPAEIFAHLPEQLEKVRLYPDPISRESPTLSRSYLQRVTANGGGIIRHSSRSDNRG